MPTSSCNMPQLIIFFGHLPHTFLLKGLLPPGKAKGHTCAYKLVCKCVCVCALHAHRNKLNVHYLLFLSSLWTVSCVPRCLPPHLHHYHTHNSPSSCSCDPYPVHLLLKWLLPGFPSETIRKYRSLPHTHTHTTLHPPPPPPPSSTSCCSFCCSGVRVAELPVNDTIASLMVLSTQSTAVHLPRHFPCLSFPILKLVGIHVYGMEEGAA